MTDARTATSPKGRTAADDARCRAAPRRSRPVEGWGGTPRWHRPGAWPREWQALAVYWLSSRLLILALLGAGHSGEVGREVHVIYAGWYEQFRVGAFPVGDVTWQYPPGAALVMLAPGAVPFLTYFQAFALLTLIADGVVQVALVRAVHRWPRRSAAGAWLWAVGLPLMLHLPYARYDVQVTALTVLALLGLSRLPRLGGALAGLGALVKVWPALAVIGAPRGRTTREVWTALLVTCAALGLLLTTMFRGTLDFLTAQRDRGVEIESLGGGFLQVARLFGWKGTVRHQYGSFEFLGPYVPLVARLSLLLTAMAFCWLLLWRVRARRWTPATPCDAALTAVLLFTVTSRVLSPQYLVWLLGLAAVCLTMRDTTQRPVAGLLLLAAALTAADYPLFFTDVIQGNWHGATVIVVRNALLVTAAFLSCLRLWRAGTGGTPAEVADRCPGLVSFRCPCGARGRCP